MSHRYQQLIFLIRRLIRAKTQNWCKKLAIICAHAFEWWENSTEISSIGASKERKCHEIIRGICKNLWIGTSRGNLESYRVNSIKSIFTNHWPNWLSHIDYSQAVTRESSYFLWWSYPFTVKRTLAISQILFYNLSHLTRKRVVSAS